MDDSNNHLSLRKVIKTDEILLFDWTNDPDVRKWSFNKNSITLDVHKIWFKQKFDDVNVLMWIFEVNSKPAGMVRLEKIIMKLYLTTRSPLKLVARVWQVKC